ncbi:MAG: hypothetical protein R2795_05300 [Saprospiraceae bacterium]
MSIFGLCFGKHTRFATPVDDIHRGPSCNSAGSIGLVMQGGQAPYTLSNGHTSGNATSNTNSHLIGGLQGGVYTINITDVNGCGNQFTVTVPGVAAQAT